MSSTIRIFDPSAPPPPPEEQYASQYLDTLKGKVVGFIDNAKPNFNHLVDDLSEILMSQYGVKSVIKHGKRTPGIPAPKDVMKDLVQHADLVITGSGD